MAIKRMGTDLDIEAYLKKTKLASLQYEQPPHELEGITQSTQQTNPQFFIQLLQMLQRRLRNEQNASDSMVIVMIQLGQNQHLIIASSRHDTFAAGRHERLMEEQPNHRARPMRSFMQRVRQNEQMAQRDQMRSARRQHRIRRETQNDARITQEQQVRQNRQQETQQMIELQQQFNLSLSQNHLPNESTIPALESSVLQLENLNSIPIYQDQQPNHQNNLQANQVQNFYDNPDQPPYFRIQNAQQQVKNPHLAQAEVQVQLNQSVNCLNQISIRQTREIRPREQPAEDDQLSCWQTFVRAMRRFFGRNY